MEPVGWVAMGGQNKYIRIRSDDVLKAALTRSAELHVRKESDEARYLLMQALGLREREYDGRAPAQKKQGRS